MLSSDNQKTGIKDNLSVCESETIKVSILIDIVPMNNEDQV